jgi:hypothetical protein
MAMTYRAGVAIAAAIALGTVACSGQVAATSGDGGSEGGRQSDGSEGGPPVWPYDSGSPIHDSGAGPLEAGPSGDTCQTPGVQCVVPPAQPTGATTPPATKAHQYALSRLYLGDTDRTGVPSAAAWRMYGYNLDNKVTTKTSTDVCTLAPGAAKATQTDGNGGIDNSFGENILPILITIAGSDYGARVDASIQGGLWTDLVYTVGFDDGTGNTTSATGLNGVLLGGGNYAAAYDGGAPTWGLTTHWPIRPETLNGCANGVCPAGTDPIANALVKFPAAFQVNGIFVSGPSTDLVPVMLLGAPITLPLPVRSAVITFDPNVPGSVTNGTIAGVLDSAELINAFHAIAGGISTSLCSGSAFQSIAQQILQASDIVIDPSSGSVTNTAGVACNAISIGLGFDAVEIAPPTAADIAGPTPAAPNPCGDQ